MTARLIKIDCSKHGWVFVDARLSDGRILTAMGYGKGEAIWAMVQELGKRNIELEA